MISRVRGRVACGVGRERRLRLSPLAGASDYTQRVFVLVGQHRPVPWLPPSLLSQSKGTLRQRRGWLR